MIFPLDPGPCFDFGITFFFFFSGLGGGATILPSFISFFSCSQAATASSPSFWAFWVASSPYKIKCAQARIVLRSRI